MAQSTVLRGADLSVYINNSPFGVASDLRWSIKNGRRPIFGIDSETPFDLAPGQRIIEGAITCYYVRGGGGLEGAGVVADGDVLLFEKYSTLTVTDRVSGDVILSIQKMNVGDQSWTAAPKGLVQGSFSFIGIPI